MTYRCIECGNKLYLRKVGLVCKNWKCKHYHKCNGGSIFDLSITGEVIILKSKD